LSVGESLIQIKDIHYTYLAGSPLAKPALAGASLELDAQHVLGLAGPNGSGKSTLLQHVNGILRPGKGSVKVGDLVVSDPCHLAQIHHPAGWAGIPEPRNSIL